MKLTFEQWKEQVDRILTLRLGLTSDDLPDCDYQEMFRMHVSPVVAASRVIRNAKDY